MQTYFSFSLRSRAPGKRPISHSTWKPLQMPTVATPRPAAAFTSAMIGDSDAIAPQRR